MDTYGSRVWAFFSAFFSDSDSVRHSVAHVVCAFVYVYCFMTVVLFLAHALYLSGDTPTYFVKGDPLPVKVRRLASVKTQLTYSYYSLPYCRPKKIVGGVTLEDFTLYEVIGNSPYKFKMLETQMCHVVCHTTLNGKDAKEFKEKIDAEYRVNMMLNNLPLLMLYKRSDLDSLVYQQGFPVGGKMQHAGKMEQRYFINNHLKFTVMYHKDEKLDAASIVGFEVEPFSVKHEYEGKWNDKIHMRDCDPHAKYIITGNYSVLDVEDEEEIIFTYDVEFQESEIKWASISDVYVGMVDSGIHWFSIFHSTLTFAVLMILAIETMTPQTDMNISLYRQLEAQGEAGEETGWIFVRGDVFRPPTNSDLLCVLCGTGVQCFGMILVAMFFAALRLLSLSNQGGSMTVLLFVWVFMGLFAGYTSASLYKRFKGTNWKKITLKTSFPGIVFVIFFTLNALSWGGESWGAVPFGSMFALVLLLLGFFIPLVFVGGYVGFMKPAFKDDPVKTNRIPREIPKQAWFMNPVFTILIGGIFPFVVVSVELFFIITSIWLHRFYGILGFFFPVFLFLVAFCSAISVLLCNYQLCREDYLWWWRSYLTSGSSALYVFLYAAFFFTKLNITEPVSCMLYFGYALIGSLTFFVLTGTIGFFACFFFTRHAYSSLKNE